MKSKKDVYVKVDTEKKVKKFLKLIDMFGENLCEGTLYAPWVSGKEEVTIKELRNILAAEHLKKGDYFISGVGDYRWLVKFDSFNNGYFRGTYINTEGNVSSVIGSFCNFIRFATDEEIKSFESKSEKKELTPDDYKDKTWYKRNSGSLIFIDKSVDSNLGIRSTGYCFDSLTWFKHFQLNEFNVPGEWNEASYEEVADMINNLKK